MSSIHPNYFARQQEISWFSQEKVSSTSIAVLGVGGIGCNIAMLLSRLGFKKIILVDNDLIEDTNLNRQTLYSKKDINKKKVEIAESTLKTLHNLSSEIVAYDYDLFEDWQTTINLVRNCDYVLNGLDLPEIKRTLIGILCLKLNKPMIYCGTDPHSGYSGMVLYQASKDNQPCYECLQAILNTVEAKELINKYSQDNILSYDQIDWRELEKKDFQPLEGGATMVLTAMFASVLAVNTLIQAIHGQNPPERIIFDMFSNNIESYKIDKREDCLVCRGN